MRNDRRVRNHELPDQRVSDKVKQQAKWYIQNADYWIRLALGQNDKTITQKFLDAANGLVDKATYEYVLKNYVDKLGDSAKLYGEIRDVDFLTPIKERYMGEFINMFANYQVFNNDPSATLERNQYLAKRVMEYCNQQIINELNKNGFPTNQETIPQGKIEDVINDVLDNWIDDITITTQKRLELINSIVEAKDKYQQAYFYWWACEEVYTYREVHKDDVYLQVVSPLEYYRVDSGNRYVEDDDAGLRVYTMTIPQIIDRFRDEISDKEIQYLKTMYRTSNVYDGDERISFIKSLEDFAERKSVLSTTDEFLKQESNHWQQAIKIYHYVWKTEVKQGILTHLDQMGAIVETIVDSTYEFDQSLGDISLEWEWVNQVWEGWRIGGQHSGVYIKPRPILVQRERFNDASCCKLPYNGIIGLNRDNLRNPIPFRVLPYLALYRIYTLQQERAINKFKSWLLFPESILADSDAMTTEDRLAIANKDGLFPFNDTEVTAGATQSIREIATTSLNNYIQTLDALKQNLKAEAWEAANMNNARFGNTKDYGGKAVTENNYAQALMGSVWSLECFNLFRERDYVANIDYSKFAWIDGKRGSYVDPTTNQVKIVDLDGVSDFASNIGIYIRNNSDVQQKLNMMKELAFSASQNGDIDIAIEAVTDNNLISIGKNIKKALDAKREYEMQLQQAQQQAQQQTEQIISQREAAKQQFEAEQKALDREHEAAIEQMKIDSNERIWEARLQVDVNGNGHIDKEEAIASQGGYTQADINRVKMEKELSK